MKSRINILLNFMFRIKVRIMICHRNMYFAIVFHVPAVQTGFESLPGFSIELATSGDFLWRPFKTDIIPQLCRAQENISL